MGQENAGAEAFCPHCHLLVETGVAHPWPAAAMPCPHCRLLIASGRALAEAPADPGARGAAAGVFSSQARRDPAEARAGEDQIVEAIRQVAEQVGQRPERLLMVDYQQRTAGGDDMPPLSDVLAVFGSWKRARRAAADVKL